MIGHALMFLVR